MHSKFALFHQNKDNAKILWLGSFNFTGAAQVNNSESVALITDPDAIKDFENEYDHLFSHSEPVPLETLYTTPKPNASDYTHAINHTSKDIERDMD
jgi:phosphatidylserine/phosphatidylglycerophosphate/cardiolipin synthase-like enzyme